MVNKKNMLFQFKNLDILINQEWNGGIPNFIVNDNKIIKLIIKWLILIILIINIMNNIEDEYIWIKK